MSTIPQRRTATKARASETRPPIMNRTSFAYGYREVRKKLPNGRYGWVRLPLTLDDVLHPREGDVHLPSDPHTEDCTYLRVVLKARHAGNLSTVVLSDCGIYWDIPGLRHHSPDLSVIFGVKKRKDWKTFHVKLEKVWPSLIIEVTSDKTRIVDIKTKVEQYAIAKVPYYVIVDAQEEGGRRRITLIAYRLKGKAYQHVPADKYGRVSLGPVNLLLGIRIDPETGGDRIVLIDPATNREIGDYTAVDQARAAEAQARAAAEAQAQAAKAQAQAAKAQAQAAKAQAQAAKAQAQAAGVQAKAASERADAEAQARAAAEARIRELEAQVKGHKRRK